MSGEEDLELDTPLASALETYTKDPSTLPLLLAQCRDNLSYSPLSPILRVLADVARTQQGREGVLDSDLLHRLVNQDWASESPASLSTQLCRLGGNLCFDCPRGRELVTQTGLLAKLALTLMKVETDQCRVWLVLPTFLHNFCADSRQSLGQVEGLADLAALHLLSQTAELDGGLVESLSNFLSGLTDHEGKSIFFSRPPILSSLLKMLEHFSDEEVLESLLELLLDICEDEGLSNLFVDHNLCPILLSRQEEEGVLRKPCLDLLALLSSHPSVLPRLLSPDSPLHPLLPSWLGPEHSSPHQAATAALIFGNFSTSDSACTYLVTSTTVPATLVTLLVPSSPPQLLHAVVGCLRNLAVCQAARELLVGLFLPQACVQLLLHLADKADHTVTPKLVATLRLVTQGNSETCSSLGLDPSLLECLASMGKLSIVPGLTVEVARLACSLVRYSGQYEVICHCLDSDCLPLLLSLLNSPHPQLINEVLVCLNLAAAHRPPHPRLVEQLDPPFLTTRLGVTLNMQECPKEIKYNVLTLINNILEWKLTGITEAFKESNISESIVNFGSDSSLAKTILQQL